MSFRNIASRAKAEKSTQTRSAAPSFGLRSAWRKTLGIDATPHQIALGSALGVFASFTPFIGVQMVLAGLLAWAMRGSIVASLLATVISNPLSWPAIWAGSYFAGAWLTGHEVTPSPDEVAHHVMLLGTAIFELSRDLVIVALTGFLPIFKPLLVGGLVLGLIAAMLTYYVLRRTVVLFQTRRQDLV